MPLSETYGFLGAGNMAEAFCTGLVLKAGVSPKDIWACDVRPRAEIGWLDRLGILGFGSAEQVARKASTLVVAVKPKDVAALLAELATAIPAPELSAKRIISIAFEWDICIMPVHPYIEHIMQEKVCQQWTDNSTLGRPLVPGEDCAILKLHGHREPSLNIQQYPGTVSVMPDCTHQEVMVDVVKEALYVQI